MLNLIDKKDVFVYFFELYTISNIKMNKKNKRRGKMSTKNIIVNTSEPKPGILGRGDMFAIAVGIVVLLPIIFDMSIVTITNIFQVITFFMNVTVVYAI